jgi:hypothetical protein
MESDINADIKRITLSGKVDTCPMCGYADGFHVSFNGRVDRINIILICPECHTRFDPHWRMEKMMDQMI